MFFIYALINTLFGAIIGILTTNPNYEYRPSFTPPGIVFLIAWNTIYILTALIAHKIDIYSERQRIECRISTWFMILYFIQFVLQHVWVGVFFVAKLYYIAFIVIILLDITVIYMLNNAKHVLGSSNAKLIYWTRIIYLGWLLIANMLMIASLFNFVKANPDATIHTPAGNICQGSMMAKILKTLVGNGFIESPEYCW